MEKLIKKEALVSWLMIIVLGISLVFVTFLQKCQDKPIKVPRNNTPVYSSNDDLQVYNELRVSIPKE